MRVQIPLLGLLCALIGSGCVVGRTYNYHNVTAAVAHSASTKVAVAAYDQRSYVKSGEEVPSIVGILRAGVGIPYDVTTESGAPLAHDMGQVTSNALQSKGYQTKQVNVNASETPQQVLSKLQATGADRLLILQVNEWRSDTYSSTRLDYNMTLRVLDPSGGVLGEATIEGMDPFDRGRENIIEFAARVIPQAFGQKLSALLNDPRISAALQPTAAPPPPPMPPPTPPAAPTDPAAQPADQASPPPAPTLTTEQ